VEIGETVTAAMADVKQDKCAVCGRKHKDPKKAQFKTIAPGNSGWHRKVMTGIFESDGTREKVYPLNTFEPPYEYQGHHCLALSALVKGANGKSPKDLRLRLNFYLDKVGFFPNRQRNCIGLPARKSYGDFKAFWAALDANKPLQMHGPGHDDEYFAQCDALITTLVKTMTALNTCKDADEPDWLDELKKMIEQAENFAFKVLAWNRAQWRLHPDEQLVAVRIYFLPTNKTMNIRVANKKTKNQAGQGNKRKSIRFPKLSLDVGPFTD